MKLFSCIIIYFIFFVHAENQDFIDNDLGPEDPFSGSKNHPYVGLPIGTWKITDLNESEKQEVCAQQKSFCSEECGGDTLTNKNYCNQTTMSWMCSCQNQVPDVPPYHWPITLAECRGKEDSCIHGCTNGVTKELCSKACNNYYKCDKAGSPSSGLRVENEQDKPNYSLTNNANSVVYIMKFTACIFFHAYIMNF